MTYVCKSNIIKTAARRTRAINPRLVPTCPIHHSTTTSTRYPPSVDARSMRLPFRCPCRTEHCWGVQRWRREGAGGAEVLCNRIMANRWVILHLYKWRLSWVIPYTHRHTHIHIHIHAYTHIQTHHLFLIFSQSTYNETWFSPKFFQRLDILANWSSKSGISLRHWEWNTHLKSNSISDKTFHSNFIDVYSLFKWKKPFHFKKCVLCSYLHACLLISLKTEIRKNFTKFWTLLTNGNGTQKHHSAEAINNPSTAFHLAEMVEPNSGRYHW